MRPENRLIPQRSTHRDGSNTSISTITQMVPAQEATHIQPGTSSPRQYPSHWGVLNNASQTSKTAASPTHSDSFWPIIVDL
jgi:hypothetical protein